MHKLNHGSPPGAAGTWVLRIERVLTIATARIVGAIVTAVTRFMVFYLDRTGHLIKICHPTKI